MKTSTRISWVVSVFWMAFMILGQSHYFDLHAFLYFDRYEANGDPEQFILGTVIGLVCIWATKFLLGKLIDNKFD